MRMFVSYLRLEMGVYNKYVKIRKSNSIFKFNNKDIKLLNEAVSLEELHLDDSLDILNIRSTADHIQYNQCHDFAIDLWNEILPYEFYINSITELKDSADEYIKYMDSKKPEGFGFTEQDMIRYVTAQSSSAFIGIQKPRLSKFAMNAMRGTLNSHLNADLKQKSWLIENLAFLKQHIKYNQSIMDRKYADICLTARSSSASIPGHGSFRDLVLTTSYNDLKNDILSGRVNIPYTIVAGTRSDRRGKFRLICSFDGRFRIVDYLLNNGSYSLCEHGGILSKYTTEGYNNKMMWPQLARMSDRSLDSTMVCIDYKGYDTQISMSEYAEISSLLNDYRLVNNPESDILEWYLDWLNQPKMLIDRTSSEEQVLIPYYRTLASGLHGTHSFENLIGISTMIEASKLGVDFRGFWSNGDDQNALIGKDKLSQYIQFLESQFEISWNKSLINHKLAVWGKLWFSTEFHPAWEVGTFLSIWQKEGGDTSYVEDSKLQSNYCKILQVAITLIRLGKSESTVRNWIDRLSVECSIDPTRIPVALNNLSSSKSNFVITQDPIGLRESKRDLMSRTFKFKSLNVNNYYDMLLSMYRNRVYFDLNVEDVQYHESGRTFYIDRSVDYSRMVPKDVPFVFKKIYSGKTYSPSEEFVRDILQSTKSYDGPSSLSYSFKDMYTLSTALNQRNKASWYKMF